MVNQTKPSKRPIDILVISDLHLGTYGCHAEELLTYLESIEPKMVILNGDIIDIWQFSKHYWPKSHMQIINHIIKWMSDGIKVHYITGNHDEMLRKFAGSKMGSLSIENKLVININGKKTWIFHGDVFDVTMKHSKWLTKLGSKGYDLLILINAFVNFISEKLGRGKISLSKKIKNGVKKAVKFINDFEQTVAEIAIENEYDYVICGHIHHPEMKTIKTDKGEIKYLNSGDWIENLSALEYASGKWELFHFYQNKFSPLTKEYDDKELVKLSDDEVFNKMIADFLTTKSKEIYFN